MACLSDLGHSADRMESPDRRATSFNLRKISVYEVNETVK